MSDLVPAEQNDPREVVTYEDNIERWLRRPYGVHERHWVDMAATGGSAPCPCETCAEKRAAWGRPYVPPKLSARFEAWLENASPAPFFRFCDLAMRVLAALIFVGLVYLALIASEVR